MVKALRSLPLMLGRVLLLISVKVVLLLDFLLYLLWAVAVANSHNCSYSSMVILVAILCLLVMFVGFFVCIVRGRFSGWKIVLIALFACLLLFVACDVLLVVDHG